MRKKNQSTKFIKMCLADALIRLMRQGNSYSEINVSEICDLAGIGRTTYYRHFDRKNGKNELIRFKVYGCWEDYCADKSDELKKGVMKILIDFFYEQRDLFILLHENDLTMTALFDVLYLAIGPQKGDEKDAAYWKSFLACSIFGFLYNWIQTGFIDSPQYVYGLISKVYPD